MRLFQKLPLGLIGGHAYTVLRVEFVSHQLHIRCNRRSSAACVRSILLAVASSGSEAQRSRTTSRWCSCASELRVSVRAIGAEGCCCSPWGKGEWEGDWSDKSTKWGEFPKVLHCCSCAPLLLLYSTGQPQTLLLFLRQSDKSLQPY